MNVVKFWTVGSLLVLIGIAWLRGRRRALDSDGYIESWRRCKWCDFSYTCRDHNEIPHYYQQPQTALLVAGSWLVIVTYLLALLVSAFITSIENCAYHWVSRRKEET
jgi:hypothetical protein